MEFTPLVRLRVYVGESDRVGDRPVYERVVEAARDCHMTGATVYRGVMGFGAHSLIHTSKILRISEDLPIVVEIIDTVEKIEAFLPALERISFQGLVVREDVSASLVTKVRRS